ncbi:hypothetical protein IX332_000014 [Porphyromonas levii]|nr:hypothetical protein [Porphyromonas levii]MBR8712179.1 hypothetical protein [Porphyromonas levii]MBR8714355.1 hypothetical protein [Porphyromonas levii]MBR8726896.1 hypothetical protein [Porphyromonas levii]MBR8728711.1 hypothetical protein [Porphyromonas levii]
MFYIETNLPKYVIVAYQKGGSIWPQVFGVVARFPLATLFVPEEHQNYVFLLQLLRSWCDISTGSRI